MEKVKKSYFNSKLYLDGLKQLRIIGIMGAVIMACAAFLIPLGYNIENKEYAMYTNGVRQVVSKVVSYDILEMNPVIVCTFLVAVPLMTLFLFSFMNRRNACDFYHAIPDTRESLFVSYGLSILTWNAVLVVESIIISLISAGIFEYVELETENVFIVFVNLLVGSIYSFGVVAIAMSVTGTIFTNIAVAGMLAVTPRVIATAYVMGITSQNPLIPFRFGDGILDDRLNVVTNLVTGYAIRGNYDGIYMWQSLIYTLVVGIIYSIIALRLFKLRKSETATSAAVNKKLQCVLRLVPPMLISLIPCLYIFMSILDEVEIDESLIFLLVVCYVIAIIAYLLYELITTKKLKNVIKAIPGLVWLVVYNVAMVIALVVGYNVLLNDVPAVSDVKSVNINFNSGYHYSFSSSFVEVKESQNYYFSGLNDIEYKSDEIVEILVTALERSVEAEKSGEGIWGIEPIISEGYRKKVEVQFNVGFGQKIRNVYLTNEEYGQLMDEMMKDEELRNFIYAPVKEEEIAAITARGGLSKEELINIYNVYSEELKEFEFEEAFDCVTEKVYGNFSESVYIELKNEKRLEVILSPYKTPKAYNAYANAINRLSKETNPVSEFVKIYEEELNRSKDENSEEFMDTFGSLSIEYTVDKESYITKNVNFRLFNDSDDRKITENDMESLKQLELLFKNGNKEIPEGVIYVLVSYDISDYTKNEYEGGIKYYEATPEILKLIQEIE